LRRSGSLLVEEECREPFTIAAPYGQLAGERPHHYTEGSHRFRRTELEAHRDAKSISAANIDEHRFGADGHNVPLMALHRALDRGDCVPKLQKELSANEALVYGCRR